MFVIVWSSYEQLCVCVEGLYAAVLSRCEMRVVDSVLQLLMGLSKEQEQTLHASYGLDCQCAVGLQRWTCVYQREMEEPIVCVCARPFVHSVT